MLDLAFAAGLRVSELVGLRLDQLERGSAPCIHVMGKGRRERILPLWKETVAAIMAWLRARAPDGNPELFLNAAARSGFEYILAKHVVVAAERQPSIAGKRVMPHVLRHSCAMHTLQATGDVRKVALWLGHASLQSTEIYLRADPTEKLEALASMAPLSLRRGKFQAPDTLIAMLKAAGEAEIMRSGVAGYSAAMLAQRRHAPHNQTLRIVKSVFGLAARLGTPQVTLDGGGRAGKPKTGWTKSVPRGCYGDCCRPPAAGRTARAALCRMRGAATGMSVCGSELAGTAGGACCSFGGSEAAAEAQALLWMHAVPRRSAVPAERG